jgi:glutamate-1-semialdehyde 2,1-aminomutase
VPIAAGFLEALREETLKAGALLIFDEVVTGFRVAPGGAQALFGVTPDLSTFAKILAGGLPGGGVAGRADVLAFLETKASGHTKIHHPGTFNANPLSAAAGVAMLASIADGEAQRLANAQAAKLRYGMNAILAREKISWKVYGQHSDWKLYYGADAPPRDGDDQSVDDVPWQRLDARHPQQSRALRQALILQGIDFNGGRALVGTCHTDDVIAETLAGFEAAVRAVKESGQV